jgi:beta-lactamase class D
VAGIAALLLAAAPLASAPPRFVSEERSVECLLVRDVGGEVRRHPARGCDRRLTPASTFKIPHALAALDAGVVSGPQATRSWDGQQRDLAAWNRDHTLASAMRDSVVWYFQAVARELGLERERAYLERLDYGNADPSSGLSGFWLGGSLRVSPEEQLRFLDRFFALDLPVSGEALRTVSELLRQPEGRVVNALGEHTFAAPWPPGTSLEAKTGFARESDGTAVAWLVGRVRRGGRAWVFVSCVAGRSLPAGAAVEQAARGLAQAGVFAEPLP